MKKRRDWKKVVTNFGNQKRKLKRITLSSDTVAQVTRCRLLARFPKLSARTVGADLILEK